MKLPHPFRNAGSTVIGRIPMKIRSGPNEGMRWSAVSAGRGTVSGKFEHDRLAALVSMVREGDCVWDVGAHKGYATLAAARNVGADGKVYAFEPAPPNLKFLRRHVAWNELTNVEIVPTAISSSDGFAQFGGPGAPMDFKLGAGKYQVQVKSITSLMNQGLRRPDIIKIDVEGHESEVLRGAMARLRSNMLIIAAIHSYDQYLACTGLLQQAGFRVLSSRAVTRNLHKNPVVWDGDPDILGIGPDREFSPAALENFK